MPHGHLLHSEELPCPEGCVFRTARAPDLVAIVGLLAAQGGAGEAVGAAEAPGKGGHHDVAGDRPDDEGCCDDEALRHQDHHEEGQEGPDVGGPFRVAQLGDERRGYPGDGREDPRDHYRVDREGDERRKPAREVGV